MEHGHLTEVGCVSGNLRRCSRDRGERLPAHASTHREIDELVVEGADDTGSVLGALAVAGTPVKAFGDSGEERHQRAPSGRSTIQVSFDPPPWEELTTSDPSGSATRVRPPGVT